MQAAPAWRFDADRLALGVASILIVRGGPQWRGEHRSSAPVGRPAKYKTEREYAGRGSLCSRAINRPGCREGAAEHGRLKMRVRLLAVAAVALVSGCSDPVKDAEKRLELVERHGSASDKCAANRELQQAYLNAGREADYASAKLSADLVCMNADFERRYGPSPDTRG